MNPEKRKYKCEHCAKGFSTNQALKDHIDIHTGERSYICKLVEKLLQAVEIGKFMSELHF